LFLHVNRMHFKNLGPGVLHPLVGMALTQKINEIVVIGHQAKSSSSSYNGLSVGIMGVKNVVDWAIRLRVGLTP